MSKISELTDGGSLLPTDFLIAVRSGGNVKVQADDITVDQVNLGDNEFIRLGNSQDLTLVHDASNSIINQAGTGDLLIQKAGTTKASFTTNGLEFPDSSKAIFGAGSDLQIYHDGNHSYLKDAGTGDLYIQGEANVRITDGDGNKMFLGQNDGEVQLYYNGAEKLNTTNTGIDVTGTVTADGITNNGDVVFSKSATGVPIIKMSGFATANNPYAIINFYNEDGSQQGPNNAAQIKAIAKNSDGSGGELAFHTSTGTSSEGADAVERLRIDASGSVGIGVTPKTTNATVTGSLNVNQAGLLVRNSNQAYFASNIYWDASDQLKSHGAGYGLASLFIPSDGSHRFFNTTAAATGADENLTLNETMRIDASGNVGIGGPPDKPLHLKKSTGWATMRLEGASDSGGELEFYKGSTKAGAIYFDNSNNLNIRTGNTESMRIDSGGRLGISNSSPASYTGSASNSLVLGNSSSTTASHGMTIVAGNQATSSIAFSDHAGDGGTTDYRGLFQYVHADDSLRVFTASAERFRIASDGVANFNGDVKVLSGDIQMGSGRGINFSATADSSGTMSSETLDDYEEGTWTPTAYVGSTQQSISAARASYTKIGDLVTVNFSINASANFTSSDIAMEIRGLPFASSGTAHEDTGSLMVDNLNWNSAHTYLVLYKYSGDANDAVLIYKSGDNLSWETLNGTEVAQNNYFIGQITYRTA